MNIQKNILIVDNLSGYVTFVVDQLRGLGWSAMGLIPESTTLATIYDGQESLDCEGPTPVLTELIKNADLIFLEHTMPLTGDKWIIFWEAIGINFSQKRVVGISKENQPYLRHRIPWIQLKDHPAETVRRFLT